MNRRAVVTAGTGGIGLETAKGLAQRGFAVTVVGRNAERGAKAVQEMAAVATGGAPRFVAADLASLGQVRELAAQLADEGPLGVLVNNVGAMFADRQRTVDGIEASFAVNHLSPYLLTGRPACSSGPKPGPYGCSAAPTTLGPSRASSGSAVSWHR